MSPQSFVGRERDVTRIQGLLRTRARLVTIVGPAGVGKTRLAHEIARESGCLFTVALAGARSLDDVCRLLARALGIPLGDEPTTSAAVRRLARALADRATASESAPPLIVLDELERLPIACAEAIAGWAQTAERLRFLTTSRSALRVPGETLYELLPLAPAAAMSLLTDRASIALDGSGRHHAETIIDRLEGFPLAIELAAAMLETQSPAALAASLDQLLAAETTVGSEDQRSLRGAIRWAIGSLEGVERQLLTAACVFSGGFTVEALAVVAAMAPNAAAAQLARLRGRALVFPLVVAEGLAPRFDVYDSVRRHVAAALEAAHIRTAEERHRAYFLERHCALGGTVSLQALEVEQANLHTILEHSGSRAPATGDDLRVLVALAPLRIGRAPLDVYLQQLDIAIAVAGTGTETSALLAMAHVARGRSHALAGRLSTARVDLERAVALAERSAGEALIAQTSIQLAIVARELGDTKAAVKRLQRAAEIGKRIGEPGIEAEATGSLARAVRDDGAPTHEAIELAERAVSLARHADDLPTAARMESRLGTLLIDVGRHDDARDHFEAARALAVELGLRDVDAIVTMNLGVLEHDLRQLGAAEGRYRAAVAVTRELGLGRLEGGSLMLLSLLLLASDRAAEASKYLAEALEAFEGSRQSPYGGLTHIALGAALAEQDRIDEAEQSIGAGQEILARGGDVSVGAAGNVLAATLDVARCRAARARSQASEACAASSAAREVVAHVKAAAAEPSAPASAAIVRLALAATTSAIIRAETTPLPIGFARDGSFVDLPGRARIDLRSQPQSRRILLALIEARRQRPGSAVERDDLVHAVWPAERLPRATGKNRLHVAMNQLRTLGLRQLVLTRGGGYLLDPDLPLYEIEPNDSG